MLHSRSHLIAASLVTLIAGCSPSLPTSSLNGSENISDVAPGITRISRVTDTPVVIQAIKIDLTLPQNKIYATASADRKKTTSKFAEQYRCSVAINADFFHYDGYQTVGLAVGKGEPWEGTSDTASWASLIVNKNNEARLSKPEEYVPYSEDMFAVVGGKNWLIEDGNIVQPACENNDSFCLRHPRTAVGLSQDGKTLFMVAVEGRSSASKGATLPELAEIMKSFGVDRAMNLDGGGSTAMIVNGNSLVRPSDGSERVVANHLGVCQGPAEAAAGGTLVGVTYTNGDTKQRVGGVKVTLGDGQSVTSDANGVYRFSSLKAGSYTLTFEKEGMATQTLTRDVAASGETWGSISL